MVAAGAVGELVGHARQPFSVVFRDAVPEGALRAAPGVRDLEIAGHEARGSVAGSPDGLLGVLAAHPVDRLLLPEPDLEQAFLGFYSGPEPDDRTGADGAGGAS